MRETFKLEWILIGCQCFIVGQLEKNHSESDSNDIVPHIFIVIAVVWTLLFLNMENDFRIISL